MRTFPWEMLQTQIIHIFCLDHRSLKRRSREAVRKGHLRLNMLRRKQGDKRLAVQHKCERFGDRRSSCLGSSDGLESAQS